LEAAVVVPGVVQEIPETTLFLTSLLQLAVVEAPKLVTEHQVVLVAVGVIAVMVGPLRKETQAAQRDTATLVETAPLTELILPLLAAAAVLVRLVDLVA